MVFWTRILLAAKAKPLPRNHLRSRFMDSIRLHVRGGTGGTGLPKYGGIGGQGGCVYCVGKEGAELKRILTSYPNRKVLAGHGEDSHQRRIVGAPGRDEKIEVPLGVTVYGEEGKVFAEINEEGQTCILARGGPGGNKNSGFLGHTGQNHHVRLDLRLIADVGLVGFPNAGKSSLLKLLSRAKPRIANYPFTTLRPNIGVIKFKDLRQITVADLPGLIEGAHINVGLGHMFLKHVERTKILLLVADVNGFALSNMHKARSCFETVLLLNKELELYNKELLDKPALLAINKMDLPGADDTFKYIKESILNIDKNIDTIPNEIRPEKIMQFDDIVAISALNYNQTITDLKELLRKRLDEHAESADPDIKEPEQVLRKHKAMVRERGPQIT